FDDCNVRISNVIKVFSGQHLPYGIGNNLGTGKGSRALTFRQGQGNNPVRRSVNNHSEEPVICTCNVLVIMVSQQHLLGLLVKHINQYNMKSSGRKIFKSAAAEVRCLRIIKRRKLVRYINNSKVFTHTV